MAAGMSLSLRVAASQPSAQFQPPETPKESAFSGGWYRSCSVIRPGCGHCYHNAYRRSSLHKILTCRWHSLRAEAPLLQARAYCLEPRAAAGQWQRL
jgi:hypothetical protein